MVDQVKPEQPDDEAKNGLSRAADGRRRRWGWWVAGGVGGVLLLLLAVALLPTLLSTGVGTRWVAGVVNDSIAGSVTIDDASFGWLGGQSLSGVTLRDPQDEVVARIARIDAPGVGLLPLIFGGRELGEISVAVVEMHIRQPVDGPTNLEEAVAIPAPPQPESPAAPTAIGDLAATLRFTAERITYQSPDIDPVELTDVTATVSIPDPTQIGVQLATALRQNETTGRASADVTVIDAFDAAGVMQIGQAKVDGEAAVENLPVAVVDRLAQQDGLLVALLGEQLSARVQTSGGVDELDAQVTAQSERLTIDTPLHRTDRGLTASGGTIRLQVTPEAFAMMAAPGEGAGGASAASPRLLQPFTVNANVRSLLVPATADGVRVADAQFDVGMTSEPIVLDVPEQGRVAVRDLAVLLQSTELSDRLTARLAAGAEIADAAGPVSATATVRNLLSEQKPLAAEVQTERLPVVLIDALAGQGGRLVQTLGETLTADVEVTRQAAGDLAFAGTIQAPNVAGPFEGRYAADGLLTLATPQPLAVTLTPAAYHAWVLGGEPTGEQWVLDAPADLRINIEELAYAPAPADADASGDAPLRIDPGRTRIVGRIGIASAVFAGPARERVGVSGGELVIEGRDLREVLKIVANLPLAVEASEEGISRQPRDPDPRRASGPASGAIESTTEVRGLFSATGELRPAEAQIASRTSLRGVPSGLIDSLAGQGGELAAVLGGTASAEADVLYRPDGSGRADLTLDTTNVKGSVPATITEAGVLQLREDAALAVNVTPEVSRVMLGKVTPMLASAVSARVPLKLTVAAEGFSAPLQGFDWRQVSANAVLDSGDLTLAPQGFAGLVLNALNQFGGARLRQQAYQVSLRPVPLAIAQGRMRYDNLTLGVAGATFDFGGLVDLAAGRFDLKMTFGGEALPKELRGVTVPIQGPFNDPLSRETLTKALAGAMINVGIREGLGELLGERRGEQPRSQPNQGQPQQPADQPQAEPERPRDPLQQLLDIGRGALEAERRKREEERQQQQQEQQNPQQGQQ